MKLKEKKEKRDTSSGEFYIDNGITEVWKPSKPRATSTNNKSISNFPKNVKETFLIFS